MEVWNLVHTGLLFGLWDGVTGGLGPWDTGTPGKHLVLHFTNSIPRTGERKDFEVYSCDVSPDGKRLVTAAGGEHRSCCGLQCTSVCT